MRRTIRQAALFAIALLAGTGVLAEGQSGPCPAPGCPDPSFGPSQVLDVATGTLVTAPGIVTIPAFGGAIGAIAVQNIDGDERIVALNTSTGAWRLARYRATAGGVTLDSTFGVSGVVTKTIKGTEFTAGNGIFVQTDNKLVVVGSAKKSTRFADSVLTVVRYTSDGQEDPDFGNGGAVTLTGYSGARACLQPDGKILLAAAKISGGLVVGNVVMRLAAQGSPDETFGADGVAALPDMMPNALAVQRVTNIQGDWEDKIVVSGTVVTSGDQEPFHFKASLVRLNADGSRDWTFAGSGAAEIDAADAEGVSFRRVSVDAEGRVVVAGDISYRLPAEEFDYTLDPHVLVARYDADGFPDPAFGTGGMFTQALPAMSTQDLAIDSGNRILVSGWPSPTYPSTRGLVAWRLTDMGVPDPAFGSEGMMRTGTMWAGLSEGSHVAFVAGGSTFLVGGSAYVKQSKRVVTEVGALGRFLY